MKFKFRVSLMIVLTVVFATLAILPPKAEALSAYPGVAVMFGDYRSCACPFPYMFNCYCLWVFSPQE